MGRGRAGSLFDRSDGSGGSSDRGLDGSGLLLLYDGLDGFGLDWRSVRLSGHLSVRLGSGRSWSRCGSHGCGQVARLSRSPSALFRGGHLATFFTPTALRVVHPVVDERLELSAEVSASERILTDDREVLVDRVGAVPLEGVWKYRIENLFSFRRSS